jgi:hypothetical protein
MPDVLTAEKARKIFSYDEQTGLLHWRIYSKSRKGKIRPGDVVGSLDAMGYVVLRTARRNYKAHRVIWLIKTGSWPASAIDHRNGIKNDNRWGNLRLATSEENAHNRCMRRTNKYGFKGVWFNPASSKYLAAIKVCGKTRHLGEHSTLHGAAVAYATAAKAIYGDFTSADVLSTLRTIN